MAAVERTTELPAESDQVWRMLSDERALGAWLGGEVSIDLRPGGHLSLDARDGTRMVGDVVDVLPGQRLAFVWWSQRPFGLPRRSRVQLTLQPRGATTVLRLRESQLAAPPVTIGSSPRSADHLDVDGDPPLLVGAAP